MTVYDSLCPKFTLNSLLGMCSLLGTTIPDPNFGPRNFHIKSFVFPSHFAQNSWWQLCRARSCQLRRNPQGLPPHTLLASSTVLHLSIDSNRNARGDFSGERAAASREHRSESSKSPASHRTELTLHFDVKYKAGLGC